jgi:hypothetical protein
MSWGEHSASHGAVHAISDVAASVAIVTPKRWRFKAPDDESQPYLRFRVSGSNAIVVEIFEAPTLTANGTALAVRNLNRNEADRAVVEAAYDMTASADGTRVGVARAPANVGVVGPGFAMECGMVLKRNTHYQLKVTVTVDATALSLDAEVVA